MTTNIISENLLDKNLIEEIINIDYQKDSILIKGKTDKNIVFFVIDKNQGLFEHAAVINAVVNVIEGEIDFIISGKNYKLTEGSEIEIPSNAPHSFRAIEKTKMILTVS